MRVFALEHPLLRRAARGHDLPVDSRKIAELFERHGPAVYRRAHRLLGNGADAEEATQEVFIRVFRGVEAFKHRAQLTTWLYQITTNYCLNALRDRKRRNELSSEKLEPMEESEAARAEDLVLLRELLVTADAREAEAAIYVFVDGMSHDETAALLNVSRRTVGNLVERFAARAAERGGQP